MDRREDVLEPPDIVDPVTIRILRGEVKLDTNFVPFAVYVCTVKVATKEVAIFRRFSQFQSLDQQLRRKFPNEKFALPPRRSIFRSGTDPSIVESRKGLLQAYMENIIANSHLRHDSIFIAWICSKNNPDVRSMENPQRAGWLVKEGHLVKNWKKRWFVLKDGFLFYFRTPEDMEPMGIVPLRDGILKKVPESDKQFCFKLCPKNAVIPPFFVCASDNTDYEEWIRLIKKAIHSRDTVEMDKRVIENRIRYEIRQEEEGFLKAEMHSLGILGSLGTSTPETPDRLLDFQVEDEDGVERDWVAINTTFMDGACGSEVLDISLETRLVEIKRQIDAHLGKYIESLVNTLRRLNLLVKTSSPSTYQTTINGIHVLEQLKKLSARIIGEPVESLKLPGRCRAIVIEIQSLFIHPTCNEYVTRLLYIFSPLSRTIECYHSNRSGPLPSPGPRRKTLTFKKLTELYDQAAAMQPSAGNEHRHSSKEIPKEVCRICEEDVPRESLKEHLKCCAIVHDPKILVLPWDNQLEKIISHLREVVDQRKASSFLRKSLDSARPKMRRRTFSDQKISDKHPLSDSDSVEGDLLAVEVLRTVALKAVNLAFPGTQKEADMCTQLMDQLKNVLVVEVDDPSIFVFGTRIFQVIEEKLSLIKQSVQLQEDLDKKCGTTTTKNVWGFLGIFLRAKKSKKEKRKTVPMSL
eukprot:TRINITY_DN3170_c0_g1_i5.p1 TRINITY_DN3170_c0_g1~~TRINITY_DN3170_c0_g1_i5.p1  ORF type:complete len:692 (-),score=166.49 TRINITY_DN3170_c0_g1_i5:1379-3454(-)